MQPGAITLHPTPDQPPNELSRSGVAVSTTEVPLTKETAQSPDGQSIPAGLELIDPPPLPSRATDSTYVGTKVALTVKADVIERVQLSVSPQGAPHPAKAELPYGIAVNVTEVPLT